MHLLWFWTLLLYLLYSTDHDDEMQYVVCMAYRYLWLLTVSQPHTFLGLGCC